MYLLNYSIYDNGKVLFENNYRELIFFKNKKFNITKHGFFANYNL